MRGAHLILSLSALLPSPSSTPLARVGTHINYGEQIEASRGSLFEDVRYSYCWCVLPAFVAATVDGRSLRTERWEEVPLAPPDMCVIFVMAAGEG